MGGGDKTLLAEYVAIIKKSSDVLTEVFVKDAMLPNGTPLSDEEVFQRDNAWLKECDVAIMDVSNPSLGVGYEVGILEKMNKPILALYNDKGGKRLSGIIAGNPKVEVLRFKDFSEVEPKITSWLAQQSL